MKNTMKYTIAMTVATLAVAVSMLLTGCVDNTATPDQAQATQATSATINKNATEPTQTNATEKVDATAPTTSKVNETTAKSENATESKKNNNSGSNSNSSSSSSNANNSGGNSSGNNSSGGNSSGGNNSGGNSSGSNSSGGGSSNNNSGGSNNSNNSSADPHAGKTYHEAVYEDVWVVDQEAYSYEEPVYETRGYTICHVCGAEFDTTNDTSAFWAHDDQHLLAGEGSGYHNEVREVQTGTRTVNVPEEGHWEKKLIKEAGWY